MRQETSKTNKTVLNLELLLETLTIAGFSRDNSLEIDSHKQWLS